MMPELPQTTDADRRRSKPKPKAAQEEHAAPPKDREDEELYSNVPCTD